MPPPTPHETSQSPPCLPTSSSDAQSALDHSENTPAHPLHSGAEPSFNGNLPRPSLLDRTTKDALEYNSQSFAHKQNKSTPIAQRTSKEIKKDPKRDDHKEDVAADLGPVIGLEDGGAWARSLYLHLIEGPRIEQFLRETNLYCQGKRRWVTVPEHPTDEKELYDPFIMIFNSIFVWFVLKFKGKKLKDLKFALRQAIDTHSTNLPHRDQYPTTLMSRPDVSVRASGASSQAPEPKEGKEDHLDDLESFLYIYNHIIHKYDWKGSEFPVPYTLAC
ncbi:hypothetical protein EST38_g2528 [Candolleomyces aberdarensis]|uniref:Uncharacterized protein n=1 Tax=Candolleomyces aberdarensis TaxID=2316362 RepID=A0A4Q2DST9_9AGAR|nr:hypothetical protein EST38_g2528 [Candolleomyces aberdarensis]